MLKVISGRYRGKKLLSTKNEDIRPTKSLVRESLINILSAKYGNLNDLKIADICCGSGAFGIESISRGVGFVCFVDNCKKHLDIAQVNLKNIEGNYILTDCDILNLQSTDINYDIIFLDPPYNMNQENLVFENLVRQGWMSNKTLLVYEASANKELFLEEKFTLIKERKYGKTKLFFIKLKEMI